MATPNVVMGRPLCFTPVIYLLFFIAFSCSTLWGWRTSPCRTFASMFECGV